MYFYSFEFIFLFLPIFLIAYYASSYLNKNILFLVVSFFSIFFYFFLQKENLYLLLSSILINYIIGSAIIHYEKKCLKHGNLGKKILTLGIAFNILILAYFKYLDFILINIKNFISCNPTTGQRSIPIGISFYTFIQIAFLVDVYKKRTRETNLLKYTSFASFFPYLFSGPIVRHNELSPQISKPPPLKFNLSNLSVGLSLFSLGLFKKIFFADKLSIYVLNVLGKTAGDPTIGFIDAWGISLAYTLQIYFDFSGYSDMAIGCCRMAGIKIPVNFNSPYKSTNIIDFWRRWHITLSSFLRDYLYIPLGGNRKGNSRKYANILITMAIGGVWHGAGWNFIIWGILHGMFLVINNLWIKLKPNALFSANPYFHFLCKTTSIIITFFCVMCGWIIFCTDNMNTAISIFNGLFAFENFHLPDKWFLNQNFQLILLLLFIVWFLPNTQEIVDLTQPKLAIKKEKKKSFMSQVVKWHPGYLWGSLIAMILTAGVVKIILTETIPEFLYFKF